MTLWNKGKQIHLLKKGSKLMEYKLLLLFLYETVCDESSIYGD